MILRHLRIFVTVYREMSITNAAAKLHLAQPSVSLAIKELEEEYQVRLFDRINRKLSVTEKGIQFYTYANHILELFDEMDSSMRSMEMPGDLRLGSSITIGNCLVPVAVQRFHERYPNCQVKVTIQNSQQVIQAVIKNEQDLGVVEDHIGSEQLNEVPFMRDQMYFLCGKNHPLAGRKKVTLEEICSYPLFLREKGSASREITEGLLKTNQLKGNILWESVSNQALIRAVEHNEGITILSEKLVENEIKEGSLVVLPLYPEAFTRSFSLIYHKKKYITEAMRGMMELFYSLREECTSQ